MEVGLRVVRGPDWNLRGNEGDGGEGFVGTVVEVEGKSSRLAQNLVRVQWDSGIRHDHRAGQNGAYDLYVLDSAPIGIKHEGVECKSCHESPILGMRWNCVKCGTRCNLCTLCYMADEHPKDHGFRRIDFPDEVGVLVNSRVSVTRIQSTGIFPGAKVVRGGDWQWKDQDGGEGKEGVVIELRNWKKSPRRGVLVSWDYAEKNTYRLGVKGKVDIKCVEPSTGVNYYKDHLPRLGEWKHKLRAKETGANAMLTRSSRCENPKGNEPGVGDSVCVSLAPDIVKAMNSDIKEWRDEDNKYLGMTGTVHSFSSNGGVQILYDDKKLLTFHPELVAKVDKDAHRRSTEASSRFKRGDVVKITEDEEVLRRLQHGHGAWNELVRQARGKKGRVINVTPEGHVQVALIGQGEQCTHVFNAAALSPLAEGNSSHATTSLNDSSGRINYKGRVGGMVGPLRGLFQGDQGMGRFLSAAVAAGDPSVVENLLNNNPHLANYFDDSVHTPLVRACQSGNPEMVSLLLSRGADINLQDSQGYRAIHHAANSDRSGATARILIAAGANVDDAENHGSHTPLHLAATESNPETVRLLLKANCKTDGSDFQGFTALHYAAQGDHTGSTARLLIDHGVDVNRNHNDGRIAPLHVAVNEFNPVVVEMLLNAGCNANITDSQELTALHVAARRDMSGSMAQLLIKHGVDLNTCTNLALITPLHVATIESNVETIRVLAHAGCDVNIVNREGNTALHEVMRHGSVWVAEALLDVKTLDINKRNHLGVTCFTYAILRQCKEVAKNIFEKSPGVASIPAPGGTTTLHFAALYNDTETLQLVLDSGKVNIHARNKDGLTPLDLARATHNRDAVRLLEARLHGSKPSGTNHTTGQKSGNYQWEPAQSERRNFKFGDTVQVKENRQIVELLQLGHGGWNSGMNGVIGQMGMVEKVYDTGDVRVSVQDMFSPFAIGYTFNPLALKRESPENLPSTVDTSAVNVVDNLASEAATGSCSAPEEFSVMDPLMEYAFISDSFLDLIPEYCDEHREVNTENATRTLYVACRMRWFRKVQEIASLHPEAVNGKEGDHPLFHVCCFAGDFEIVELLVRAGADVSLRDENRLTPLHVAAMGDKGGRVTDLLLSNGADPNDQDNESCATPLHLAVIRNSEGAAKNLCARRDISINSQDSQGDSAFHVASSLGREELVSMMLAVRDIDTGLFNKKGLLPVHLAAKKGHVGIVKELLKHNREQVNVVTSNEEAMACVHFAAKNGFEEVIRVLQATEICDLHIRNRAGQTALDMAEATQNKSVSDLLKEQKKHDKREESERLEEENVEEEKEEDKGVLQEASSRPQWFASGDVVQVHKNQQLIGHSLESSESSLHGEIGQVVSTGSSGLDVAVLVRGDVVTFQSSELILVNREAQDTGPSSETRTVLPEVIPLEVFRKLARAAFKDEMRTYAAILTSWPLEINRFFNGTTLLHLASGDGFPRVLRKLIELGANLMAEDRRGLTPLHVAAARDRTGISGSMLLEKCTDPNFQASRSNNRTALHFAVLCNNPEVAKELIGSRCDVNMKDRQGNTPMHLAIDLGHDHIADLLTETENYDPLIRNDKGFNNLHQSVLTRNKYLLKRLLGRAPNIENEPTLEGDTPIHLAAAEGFDEIAKILLEEGNCRLDVRNRSNESPHRVALSSGHSELASLLWDEHDRVDVDQQLSAEVSQSVEQPAETEQSPVTVNPEGVQNFTTSQTTTTTELDRQAATEGSPKTKQEIPDRLLCCICLDSQKNITFQCGHLNTCSDCARKIQKCPECNVVIEIRITTYY